MDYKLRGELRLLARGARVLAAFGHEDLTLGHVGLRDPEGRGVWIKRRGLGLGELRDESGFLLVGWDGDVLAGEGRRHSEWPLHTEVLHARADLAVSAHTHPETATLLTATDVELPMITQNSIRLHALGLARFDAGVNLVRTRETGAALARALGTARIVLLRNHGVSFFAESVPMLALTGIYLERAAREFLTMAASGLPMSATTLEEVQDVAGSVESEAFVADCWAYLERMLGRQDGKA